MRRILLGVAGVALIGYLVHGAGPARVAQVLWQTRPWIPLIVALELTQLLADFGSLRFILGGGRGPRRPSRPELTADATDAAAGASNPRVAPSAWVRSSAMAYALMILVPAGRAAGEVARATILSKYVGAPRAARASIELQSGYVFAIGVLSVLECAVVASQIGLRSPLALLLGANALVMVVFSAGL
ncbi:MAG: hypothetical protein JOZ69_03135, partial [Myxococcales bacterium]|nr:hypothetical protein [Myxococcales bacterium]